LAMDSGFNPKAAATIPVFLINDLLSIRSVMNVIYGERWKDFDVPPEKQWLLCGPQRNSSVCSVVKIFYLPIENIVPIAIGISRAMSPFPCSITFSLLLITQ
jgi:hypothetical protein